MKAYLIVGGTNTGKTTYLKERLSKVGNKKSIIIYDVNDEHKELYPYKFTDIDTFMGNLIRVKSAVIAIEEATIFFNNRGTSDELTQILVQKRHTHNYIFLCFHSLRAVPHFVYDLCNYLTLFKTNDSLTVIDQKFKDERINEIFDRVRINSNEHYYEVLKIY